MTYSQYFKRVAVMLLVAMPLTGIVVALVAMQKGVEARGGFWDLLATALAFVYLWGIVTGVLLSIAHTGIVQSMHHRSLIVSLMLGLVLGLIAGALTPTFFTGFFNRYAILAGGFTGPVYAGIVYRIFGTG